ncbi:MAG: GNAT family N-acetyltransferase [Bacteroidetes bacterium]|nr:GNAT family N-acetyltransferase [Bacteroidota bacterium]
MFKFKGKLTSLIQLNISDAAEIVNLRNDEKFNKFLFQEPISLEEQKKWINNKNTLETEVNFKITDANNNFVGTISIYNIENHKGEFGRYIAKNPINAIEAELLLLKFCFEELKLKAVYCFTNINNIKVYSQHTKLGFKDIGIVSVNVGSASNIKA